MHRRQVILDQVERRGWTRGAELGLWRGQTYLWVLQRCPRLTLIGVDAWVPQGVYKGTDIDGNVWDHEKHEAQVREGARFFKERAIIIKADTISAAAQVEDASLDFVFIDADHSYTGVRGDVEAWRPKLKPEGYLMGHDIDWPSVKDAVHDSGIKFEVLPDNVWIAA